MIYASRRSREIFLLDELIDFASLHQFGNNSDTEGNNLYRI